MEGVMYFKPSTVSKMDKLSIEVWGSKSRWLNYLKYGVPIPSEKVHPRTGRPVSTTQTYYKLGALYKLMRQLIQKRIESITKKI